MCLTLAGVPVTGLTFATAGLAIAYVLQSAVAVDITPVTLAAITTAWAAGGFKEVDAAKFPGIYRIDLPAAVASNPGKVLVSVRSTSATDPAYHHSMVKPTAITSNQTISDPNTVRTNA